MHHNVPSVGQHCRGGNVTSLRKAVHTKGDKTPGSPYINVLSFIGFLTAVLASC